MRTEGHGRPNPMRRRLGHFGGVADRGELAEAGRAVFQAITDVVKSGIGARHAIDAAKLTKPVAGLRQRDAHMP